VVPNAQLVFCSSHKKWDYLSDKLDGSLVVVKDIQASYNQVQDIYLEPI